MYTAYIYHESPGTVTKMKFLYLYDKRKTVQVLSSFQASLNEKMFHGGFALPSHAFSNETMYECMHVHVYQKIMGSAILNQCIYTYIYIYHVVVCSYRK